MAKKKKFTPPIIGVETIENVPVFYNREGDYSVVIKYDNPIVQYSANIDLYYDYHLLFTGILKTLGAGYAVQKHDVFSKQSFNSPQVKDYLHSHYFKHFDGRKYTAIDTYLVITGKTQRGRMFIYDEKKFETFLLNIQKILNLFDEKKIEAKLLSEQEIKEYLHRYFTLNFSNKTYGLDNLSVKRDHLKIGTKSVKNISLVDIDEVNLPSYITPHKEINIGYILPTDLMSFLGAIPNVETVVYNQVIIIPEQQAEKRALEAKRKKHSSMPDPANVFCCEDIDAVMEDIERDDKLLVYAHYNIIVSGEYEVKELNRAVNFVESQLFDNNIIASKQCYNQMELFEGAIPGNALNLAKYDQFLTTSDTALCLFFKESMVTTEESPFLTYFTDRQGLPVGVDVSGKEGEKKLTNNSNFFVLGPSGSGKSFFVNSLVRQWLLNDTDIVMVDTGHSYSGLCEYYKGAYVTYSEEKPITMNPFKITKEEWNIEKQNFLKSLILLLWKGAKGKVEDNEDEMIERLIQSYYDNYFNPFSGFTEDERKLLEEQLLLGYENDEEKIEELEREVREDEMQETQKQIVKGQEKLVESNKQIIERLEKVQQMRDLGENEGEVENAARIMERIKEKYNLEFENTDEQMEEEEERQQEETEEMMSKKAKEKMMEKIERAIRLNEMRLKKVHVESLSFNSFFVFCQQMIPIIVANKGVDFDLKGFVFKLEKFYKGGKYEDTLNSDFEKSLFDEKFVVFEIDTIKDDPLLFPIVTLIIVDLFIQKMRLKENRKALIIEEAWKAIASPLMAENIKYLYKTVRKFWGMAAVVTQELDDIIGNPIVKESIIANSDILCLLDQAKFKENYQDIAQLLSLSEVEKKKIFTINNLPNKEGRSRFNEVYIRRGGKGQVYGVEVSLHEYFTFTTERIEKDTIGYYQVIYRNYNTALDKFVADLKKSNLKQGEWVRHVSRVLGHYKKEKKLENLFERERINEATLCEFIKRKYKELTN